MSVFITGATGFIAQHTIQALLDKGYTVVGTVRSVSKGDFLKSKFGDKFSYELVTDFLAEDAFDAALKAHPEVKYLLHTASPVSFEAEDNERDILLPAINGTKNILKATQKYAPQVERFVYTSSAVSNYFFGNGDLDPSVTFNEESWNPITYEVAKSNGFAAYLGSKTFAERAAWDFVENEKPDFVLSTVNPSFVFGPQLFEEEITGELNLSNEFINNYIKSKLGEEYPKTYGFFVDVRDVAKAHIAAFEKEEAKGKRLVALHSAFSEQTILDILNENVPSLKGKIAVGTPGSDSEFISQMSKFDNSKSNEIFDFKYISLRDTIVATAEQVVDYHAKK